MTGTLGHDGFHGLGGGGLKSLMARFGQLVGWAVFAGLLALAVTVALVTTVVVGLVLALAALLLAVRGPRRQRTPHVGGLETLEARPTPDGWVIEPASAKR